MRKLTFDWKFYLTLAIAIAGVVVPVVLWRFDLSSRSLTVRLANSVALAPSVQKPIQDLQVTFEGTPVKEPYLSTLELSNEGAKPIATSDFESPLEIRLVSGATLVKASVSGAQPDSIDASISATDGVITVKPLLLNPNDVVSISVISAGKPQFNARARIAGVSRVVYEDAASKKQSWLRGAAGIAMVWLAGALYIIVAPALLYPGTIALSRPMAAALMLSLVLPLGSQIRRSLEQFDASLADPWVAGIATFGVFLGTPIATRAFFMARLRASNGNRSA